MRGNGDLKIELTPQRPSNETRQKCEASKGAQIPHKGYETLDRASTGEWSDKERKGLSRDANYSRRFSDL